MTIPNKSQTPKGKGKPNGLPQAPVARIPRHTPKDDRKPVPPRAGRDCACHEDDLVFTWVSGYDGKVHPVGICRRCHKLSFDDDATDLMASQGGDVFGFAEGRALPPKRGGLGRMKAMAVPQQLAKDLSAIVGEPLAKGDYISDPEAHGLRWITLHPNGDDSTGVPVLVHDNGTEYTVVGGAGGKMNQMVLKKPKGHDTSEDVKARRAARKQRREERLKQQQAEMTADEAAYREKAAGLREEARQTTQKLTDLIREKLGLDYSDSARALMEREAHKRAILAMPGATKQQVDEYAKDVLDKQKKEDKTAVNDVINQVVEDFAKQSMGESDGEKPTRVKTRAGGKDIELLLDEGTFEEAASLVAAITRQQNLARSIEKALDGGDEEAVRGIEMLMERATPSEAEKAELIHKKYLSNASVAAHTRLVRDSEGLDDDRRASQNTVNRHQRGGAVDAINNYVNDAAGAAILTPELVKTIGVENAARVAAEYLASHGHNTDESVKDLLHRVAIQSTSAIAARFKQIEEMSENVDACYEAAYGENDDENTMTRAQAHTQKGLFTKAKYRLLNITRGQLRAAAALAFFMEHREEQGGKPLYIDGGTNEVAAHATAQGLGLKDGDYTLAKAAHGEAGDTGSYKIQVDAKDIHKLAHVHTIHEAQRNAAMDALREDVAERTVPWCPDGFNPAIILQPHQELGARAIVQQKRMVLNMGAGTGKTPTMYAAAAQLLSTGKVDRVLITMPAKPRAQQEDGIDFETGEFVGGEKGKFLAPEMAEAFVTVASGAELKKALRGVREGTVRGIITSPAMLRSHLQEFRAAGFGGDRSAYFADEIHDYGVSSAAQSAKEGGNNSDAEKASAQTKACREMSRSEYFVAGSGTLIRKSASDLHEVLDMVAPGAQGKKSHFTEEWERLARGRADVFTDVAMRGMRARLSGYMVTYHNPPMRAKEGGGREAVQLRPDGDHGKEHIVVPLSVEDKRKIRKIQQRYEIERVSEDKGVRSGAGFRRDARIQNACDLSNAKMDYVLGRLRKKMGDARANGNHKSLIVATKTTPLFALKKRLAEEFPDVPVVQITGEEDDEQVRSAMAAFNRHKGHAICIATGAANYGVNLQGGRMKGTRDVIKYHTPANQSQGTQFEHRVFRDGQDNDVDVVQLITNHPMERQANFRIKNIQGPQQTLLGDLASKGEYSRLMAAHLDEIKAAANA